MRAGPVVVTLVAFTCHGCLDFDFGPIDFDLELGCTSDGDCPEGTVCAGLVFAECTALGTCDSDDECPDGTVCRTRNGWTTRTTCEPGCHLDDDCPPEQLCERPSWGQPEECEDADRPLCDDDHDCRSGSRCELRSARATRTTCQVAEP